MLFQCSPPPRWVPASFPGQWLGSWAPPCTPPSAPGQWLGWGPECPPGLFSALPAHPHLPLQDPLSSLEWELALQLQIAEASRRLSREEKLSRQARRQRKRALLQEEERLRALEHCLGEQRRHRASLPVAAPPLDPGALVPQVTAPRAQAGGWAPAATALALAEPGLPAPHWPLSHSSLGSTPSFLLHPFKTHHPQETSWTTWSQFQGFSPSCPHPLLAQRGFRVDFGQGPGLLWAIQGGIQSHQCPAPRSLHLLEPPGQYASLPLVHSSPSAPWSGDRWM